MNIMLVSVTERTKEIGIRKSLGAKRSNIRNQFLLEAVILCNIGGLIGVLLGLGLGNIVTMLTSFAVSIPWGWAILGMVFCTLVGVSFGLLPAIKAARLNPSKRCILVSTGAECRMNPASASRVIKNIHSGRMELIPSSAVHIRIDLKVPGYLPKSCMPLFQKTGLPGNMTGMQWSFFFPASKKGVKLPKAGMDGMQ